MNRPVDYVWFSCFSFGTFRLFLFFCPEMYNWTYMFLPLLYCRVNVCYSSLTFSRLWSSWGWSSCLIHLCLLRLQLDTLQQWLLHKWVMNEWMTISQHPMRNHEIYPSSQPKETTSLPLSPSAYFRRYLWVPSVLGKGKEARVTQARMCDVTLGRVCAAFQWPSL